jgi:hypothetical protein
MTAVLARFAHCFAIDRDYIAPQHAGEMPAIRFPDPA